MFVSGAELQSAGCSSDDDDEDENSDCCSDSELIESLVDSLVSQVAGETFNLDEDDLANPHLSLMGDFVDEDQFNPLDGSWGTN